MTLLDRMKRTYAILDEADRKGTFYATIGDSYISHQLLREVLLPMLDRAIRCYGGELGEALVDRIVRDSFPDAVALTETVLAAQGGAE